MNTVAEQEEAERQRKAAEAAAAKPLEALAQTSAALGGYTEPATHPAAPPTAAEVGGYTGAPDGTAAPTGGAMLRASVAAHEEFVRSGPSVMTGVARLLDRLDDLARRMTESELGDLCIHAENILECRKEAA